MCEFDENGSNNIPDYQGNNPTEDLNEKIRESLDRVDEECKSDDANCEELFEQQKYDDTEIISSKETDNSDEILEQNERNFEDMSYEELVNKYNDVCAHDAALGEQYVKYDEQIAEISRDKGCYSSEEEWNNYIDEKINAQNEVSARRYHILSEMRDLESEMDKRKI